MITIVGCNKGGAGKSTTATNIATGLALQGADVCFVDADPQRSSAEWHAEREAAGLHPGFTLIEKLGAITSTLHSLDSRFDHVIVDVAGRNSRELVTGILAAHQVIAPHQCSQFDLNTMGELRDQLLVARDYNSKLRVRIYHAVASTHARVKDKEREEFLGYVAEFPEFEVLNAIGYSRKIYKDAASQGRSVLELGKNEGADEIAALLKEIF